MKLHVESQGLLAGLDDAALRRRIGTEPYQSLWSYLMERYQGMRTRMRTTGEIFDQGACGWHSITPLTIEAGLIFRLTGDPEALAWVETQITRLSEVYGQGDEPASGPLPAGRRRLVLSHRELALGADLCRAHLSPPARARLHRLMREICIPGSGLPGTLTHYGCGANVPVYQAVVAGICALTWGESCGYPAWQTVVDQSVTACRQFLRHGCDATGFPFEGMGYGHGVFDLIYLYAWILRQRQWVDLFLHEPVLACIPDASRQMVFPDAASLGNFNDTGTSSPWSIPWLHLTAAVYNRPDQLGFWEAFCGPAAPHRPYGDQWPHLARLNGGDERCIEAADLTLPLTFLWWQADRPRAPLEACPLPTATRAARAGVAAFRTSWHREAVFASLLASGRDPCCRGHAHNDAGHLSIVVGGEYLAVDTGRYNSNEDQHSVVLVDGRNARPTPENHWGAGGNVDALAGRIAAFQRHDMLDYCRVDAALQKNCRVADRHLLFVRQGGDDAYLVVIDNINPDDRPHDYLWQLQVHPEAVITIDGNRHATVAGRKARLDLTFVIKPPVVDANLQRTDLTLSQDIKAWSWPYGRAFNTTTLEATGLGTTSVRRPRLLAARSAENGQSMTVIVPRRNGQASLRVTDCSTANLLVVRVGDGKSEDTVIAALDHACIETDEVRGLTEFALIRREADGRVIGAWSVDGARISLKPFAS